MLAITRLDLLLSGLAVRRTDGTWLEKNDWFAYLSGRAGRTNFVLRGLPPGDYDRLQFNIGVPPDLNHAAPAKLEERHPLNPMVNGMHWNWQGGYVFLALEGRFTPLASATAGSQNQSASGFSWHLATDRLLMNVEVPVTLALSGERAADRRTTLRVALELAQVFDGIILDDETSSTHSRPEDRLADKLRQRVEQAFLPGQRADTAGPVEKLVTPLTAQSGPVVGTPYRFTMSAAFPKPALPRDNPLTMEGVALGRRLFNDPLLSRGGKQSCASCHQMQAGTVDAGKAFSVGVDGQPGKRNAMPLYNLAWKSEFFWDGRAKSLRQQALMPIQDELEMHETLANVVGKLKAAGGAESYHEVFAWAFGSSDITAERVGLALEQFLLTLTSHDAKFDRVMRREALFTAEEQRGFELFHTEHDPRRGLFGADCFHCHGGPLFQNVAFANNGLDHEPRDLGRYLATGREGDRGKFAVPSLRNVELTAPYMHDGRFATLEEAVFHYVRGVRHSPTLDPNLAKHPPGGVRLPPEDVRALVAFLRTLTEESLRPGARNVALAPSP
ncbi:MAG: cytochrome C peroxidase [Proteobacteria bacterium]|nr:cytochrome C peroxidase [Pseudomonadota bacterium]